MVVIGLGEDGNYYILDLVAERLDLKQRGEKLFELHRRWRPICTYYESYGLAADIQHIQYVAEIENYRFPIVKLGGTQKNRKVDAIRRLVPDMLQGRWWGPDQDTFVRVNQDGQIYHPMKVLFDEMVPWPYGKHDDALDAISRIYDIPVLWPNSNGARRSGSNSPKISPW
jgi:phage terminase large subunit-like protein